MTYARKTLTAAVAALVVATGSLAATGSAEAGHRRHHGGHSAAPVIAGLIGGLAIGAIAASSSRRAYAHDYGYAPVYGGGYAYSGYAGGYAPAYGYRQAGVYGRYPHSGFNDDYRTPCFTQKQPVYDAWGNYLGKRRVRVCQ
jgi:hypothetical protein